MAQRKLGREEIRRLFGETDNWLVANDPKGQQIRTAICGGAAIAMMNTQRVSIDVDIFSDETPPELRDAIKAVADDNDLPSDWMNDGAKIWAPKKPPSMERVFSGKRLHVYIPEARCLLAMKLESMRDDDIPDIKFLLGECGIMTADEALHVIEEMLPTQRLTPQLQYKVTSFMETMV